VVDRVYVCGGPGSGKSTFAASLSARTGIEVIALDEIAREGGGRGTETTDDERAAAVARILEKPRWIAEGVHLGWTQPLMAAADKIVWLDHVSAAASSGRITRRFFSQAWSEFRRRKGREKFFRFRDYGRKLRELFVSVPETRTYPTADLEAALTPYRAKVTRCKSAADVAEALDAVS
jgi:cytidylate kinase